jgi:leucyl-tRNA synthetase
MTLVVQVNGTLRGRLEVPVGISEEAASRAALNDDKVQKAIAQKRIVKTVYVPNRLINLVVK